MMGMPPQLSAATGMDAITHLIEAYASTNHNPVLDPMILAAISSAASALPVAVLKGENARAREAMANAALVGGIAISSKWLGACHSLAHQLSGFANVPHGLANAIMLPHVMAFNLPAAVERYADIGVALGASTTGTLRQRADAAIQLIHQLNRDIGLPATLRAAGVDAVLIPAMAKAALTLDLNWWTNPRSVDETTMARLYHEAL
jgi:alcohol dehydrogenase